MKIAILLATYNGEKYIREQLDSIFTQTYKDWVVYIHDDGSKDKTMDILKEYAQREPNRIVIVDGASTGGARNNFFYLMSKVDAPYYMCCDQDDIWLPEKIEKTVKSMKKLEFNSQDEPLLVFTELTVVDGSLNVIAEKMGEYQSLDCKNITLPKVLMQNIVTGCTMMFNKKLRDEMLRYKNVNNIIMHDWWAGIIAARYGKLYFLDEPTIMYRQHGDNSVGAVDTRSLAYVLSKFNKSREIKESLVATRQQAKEFATVFNLDENSLAFQYSKSGSLNKIKRLLFYKRNGMTKSGLFRKIGLLVWG